MNRIKNTIKEMVEKWFYEEYGCYCDADILAEQIASKTLDIVEEELIKGNKNEDR